MHGLLTLTFDISPDAQHNNYPITVTFENAMGEEVPRDEDYVPLEIFIVNGEAKVQPAVVGDLGGSGSVNSGGATLLARHMAGHYVTIDTRAADINCDGVVDLADLIRLAGVLVGIHPTLCPYGVNGCERCN